MLRKLICIAAGICLAVSYLAAGLGVCAGIPQVTRALSEATSNYQLSPYSKDVLVELACETRDFTVCDYGRSGVGASDKAARGEGADEGATADGKATRGEGADEGTTADNIASLAFTERVSQITGRPYNALDDRGFLDDAAIDHLNDVHRVIAAVFWPLAGIAALAVALAAHVFVRFGRRAGAGVLLGAGAGMLALMAFIGAWALFGFDAFFEAFHSLFFAEGTWTFPYDSLLICMYPIGFWIGMAAIWALTTAALSAASVIVGVVLRKKAGGRTKPERDSKAELEHETAAQAQS